MARQCRTFQQGNARATDDLAAHDDAALGKADPLADLQHLVPSGFAQGRVMNGVQVSPSERLLLSLTVSHLLSAATDRSRRSRTR